MRTHVILSSALVTLGGAAHADVLGFAWRHVLNHVSPYPGNAPTTFTPGTFTFDLFVIGNAVGDRINGVSFGGDGASQHINVVGSVYNHPLGGNARTWAFEQFFPDIVFDTYACFGGGPTTDGAPTQFAGLTTNLMGTGNVIQFTTFTQPPATLTAGTFGTHAAELRVLRVTMLPGSTVLGGGTSSGLIGLTGSQILEAAVPLIPAPGGAALLALPCVLAARRAPRATAR